MDMSKQSPWKRSNLDDGPTEYFLLGLTALILVAVVVATIICLILDPVLTLQTLAVLAGIPFGAVLLVYVGWFLVEKVFS
jgi:hypothetical protein